MFKNIAKAIGGNPQKKEIERMRSIVQAINDKEKEFENLSQEELRSLTSGFKDRLQHGDTLDDFLVDAYAAVREASKRTIGLRHFNVQLIGGIAMHEGMIAEMRTGEGKTLVATLPLYLNALTGEGVHLVTVNDYLARRDARWMAPIYHYLGLSVGVLQSRREDGGGLNGFIVDLDARSIKEENDQLKVVSRQEAYAADIIYGTNNEFGFDYLRDNLVMDIKNKVQRGHHYAIIDEVDNILIDEARTPLIISGPASEDVEWYSKMAVVVKQLDPEDYDFDEKDRSIALTEIGEIHVEELLQIPLRDPDRPEDITPEQARLLGYLEQALRAEVLYRKNKDYIVKNNEVVIVDEFTGRLMPGRRWSEGLHQAVEAKEGVEVNPENITHATITLQNYFRKFKKLAGMTGTALTEAEEFSTIYDLDVLEIPTNLDFEAGEPDSELVTLTDRDGEGYVFTLYAKKDDSEKKALFWKRKDYPDLVYRTEEAKLRAISLEIIKLNIIGRPQLIGTTSIEHSERLSARLRADMLQRLLAIELIRQKWMVDNQIDFLERVVPELAPLNRPLPDLGLSAIRQHGQKIGVGAFSLESEENIQILLDFMNMPKSTENIGQLLAIIKGGIHHQVLNALKHDQESQIIEGAGAFKAVTIATNMAGRGVDIKLGGEIKEEVLADIRSIVARAGIDPFGLDFRELAQTVSSFDRELTEEERASAATLRQHLDSMARVRGAGGLHVIGSERHEARRIDNQLRGRSGRQGDPGSSRFYLSLEDDLMRMFGGERAENMMRIFNLDPSLPIESKIIGRLVEQAQERVEGYNFDVRKHLLDYDDVLNDQREKIYSERDQVLVKEDLSQDVQGMLDNEVQQRVIASLEDKHDGGWKLLAFLEEIQPTMVYPNQGKFLPSYTISQLAAYANQQISVKNDFAQIRNVLIEIAEGSLLAQKDHFLIQTEDLVQRTAESFNSQFQERLEMLDLFVDTSSSDIQLREINNQLQKAVRLKIELSQDQADRLLERNRSTLEELQQTISDQLKQIFLARILMTIEQRLGQRLGINNTEGISLSWDDVAKNISKVVDERFSKNADLHSQPHHPILQNLDRLLKREIEKDPDLPDLAIVLHEMAIGAQVAINQETHQRMLRRVNMLNYVFFTADHCLPDGVEDLVGSINSHFREVQNALKIVWGKMEMQSIADKDLQFMQLPSEFRQKIEHQLSSEQNDVLQHRGMKELIENGDEVTPSAFGAGVEQVIYRHILLRSISDLWIEHLTRMEALRVSIRMEAYAQRDPLVQYKSFSTDNFKELLANIRLSVVAKMFRMQPAAPKSAVPASDSGQKKIKSPENSQEKIKKSRKRHKKKK